MYSPLGIPGYAPPLNTSYRLNNCFFFPSTHGTENTRMFMQACYSDYRRSLV